MALFWASAIFFLSFYWLGICKKHFKHVKLCTVFVQNTAKLFFK